MHAGNANANADANAVSYGGWPYGGGQLELKT
jgi:hypothetical protein